MAATNAPTAITGADTWRTLSAPLPRPPAAAPTATAESDGEAPAAPAPVSVDVVLGAYTVEYLQVVFAVLDFMEKAADHPSLPLSSSTDKEYEPTGRSAFHR